MKKNQSSNSQEKKRGKQVAEMFGRIAGWYDFLNHLLSAGQDIYWRQRLVRSVRLRQTERVLDLAAGTLDVSLEILRQYPKAKVFALDFSPPMLAKGKKKLATGSSLDVVPVCADAKGLPLPDSSMDSALMAFGIRNILPREAAYAEIFRVLSPGGRLGILEFGTGQNKICKGLYNFYLHYLLPQVGRIFSGDAGAYSYLAQSIKSFPAARHLARELLDNGFSQVAYQPLCAGIVYLHWAVKAEN